MPIRKHLRRLSPENYRGFAAVHWTMNIRDRMLGWLNTEMHYRYRELLTHTVFRYAIACPIYTLMPDHIHMVWCGITENSDQLLAIKHLRKRLNSELKLEGYELQDQAYDHVLGDEEKTGQALYETCEYIARNPERKRLVPPDGFAVYEFSGCLVPGYPELNPFADDFWIRFDRSVSFLRHEGLTKR